MATGNSGLYKNTRGAKAAAKAKYEKEIKRLAKAWNIGVERAYETIMKRIDKGLPPLPDSVAKKVLTKSKYRPKKAEKMPKALNGATAEDVKNAVEYCKANGLPIPDAVQRIEVEHEKASDVVEASKELINKCIEEEISNKVAGRHYDLEKPVNETIELIEQIMGRSSLPRVQAYLICNAAKYILRAGIKTADWGADIAKAENYLHRALHGEWNTGK